ncbi:DUF2155 domain-containing protein [Sediminimonas sp.]|uniref:DUF2155 domain-containing protein n=1 Tax=Sediminimonas sp. TaxID=2823379 RepID=UPI0025EFF9DA|nr:DUF2155 domain-containing protein [Sediminimonas sp.]
MIPAIVAAALAGAVAAQGQDEKPVSTGTGAVLRTLDRMEGTTRDIELREGEAASFHRLRISLRECRYPTDNPAGEAYAYLTIREETATAPEFAGWMLASSPALNPLDHPRYDVWVLRCTTS